MNNPQNATLPRLICIRGLPGSGKSYVARALQNSLGQDSTVVLDPDATNYNSPQYLNFSKRLTAEAVDSKLHPYRFLRSQAYTAIERGQTVIWNQAFTNLDIFNKMVANLQAHASEHGLELPVLVVEVTIDEATARARVNERTAQGGHGVPAENFARFLNDYHSFAGQGYAIVTVDGTADVVQSVMTIKQAL